MLPVLDIGGADADPAAFRTTLREAAHRTGFFYLTGHGVPTSQIAEVLGLARRFFALPVDAKEEISQLKSPQFRGYSRLGGELTNGAVDWREQIDIGPERDVIPDAQGYWRLQGPNLWPTALPSLRPALEQWSAALAEVSLRLLRHWAVSLGGPEDHFDAAFAATPATLIKVVRYPGTAETAQGVGAHKDSGVLTLLLLEPGSEGLQVETSPGRWVDVPPVDGAFVVNTGELLEVATGGYLRATRHRVLAPTPGTDRVSIPFFYNPALDTQVPLLELPPDLAAESRGVETDPDNPIFTTYGENAWKSRTRAHPDVARLHHGSIPPDVPHGFEDSPAN
ncbi:MAG: 2-oxoglutarate and iron-dependent oxygenase domain-containing protein [Mycobacterium sp.]